MLVDIETAGNVLGQLLLSDQLGGLLEVLGGGQHLGQLAWQAVVGPQAVNGVARALGVVAPAHL